MIKKSQPTNTSSSKSPEGRAAQKRKPPKQQPKEGHYGESQMAALKARTPKNKR